jgi:hypothetical protein
MTMQSWAVAPAHVGALHPFLAHVGALAQAAAMQASGRPTSHTGDAGADAQNSLAQANTSLGACQSALIGVLSSDCADAINYALVAAQQAQSADQSLPSAFQDTSGTIANAVSFIQGINTTTAGSSDAQSAVSQATAAVNQMQTDTNNYVNAPPSQGGQGGQTGPSQNTIATNIQQAAANAAEAMSASNACSTVGQSGSAANTAVHAFKVAYNASGQGTLAFNGQYDAATAAAVAANYTGTTPPACGASPSPPQPQPQPQPPGPKPPAPPPNQAGVLAWLMKNWLLVAGVGVGAVGIGWYLEEQKKKGHAGLDHEDHDHSATMLPPAPESTHRMRHRRHDEWAYGGHGSF